MISGSRLRCPVSSNSITHSDTVERIAPPRNEAAPSSAYVPSSMCDPGKAATTAMPTSRPYVAPQTMHGTKSPEGTAMPWVRVESAKKTTK